MAQSADTAAAVGGAHAPDFYVGDWMVQPGLNRTSRNGTVVHLRPQLMDVLVCLARRSGTTVSRHELLAEVWPNQFVAETALARCMAELRQALGDRAQAPAIIETIPKRGYRLIAPVSAAGGNGRSAAAALPVAEDAPMAAAGLPVAASGVAAKQAAVPAPAEPWVRATGRRGVVAAVLLVVLAAAVWLVVNGVWRGPPALTDQDAILLSFVNATGDPAFDDTLRLALAVHLEQSPFLRLVPERRAHDGLRLMGQPDGAAITPAIALQLCERVGAKAALTGTITAIGARYAIGLEATACASRETIARVSADAGRKEDVLGALSGAANVMRERLGESLSSIQRFAVPLALATTSSLEALRAVGVGDRHRDHGRFDLALTAYEDAVRFDPAFALAHARVGVIFGNLERRTDAEGPLRRAYELRHRATLNERLYITGHYFSRVIQDPLQAIDAFAAWSQSYPQSIDAHLNLAVAYQQIGLWTQALDEATRALTLDPDNAVARVVQASALGGLGLPSEGLAVLTRAAIRDRLSPHGHDLRFDLAFALGHAAAMAEEETFAANEPAMRPFLLARRARVATAEGRLRDASRLWAAAWSNAVERRDPAAAAVSKLAEAGSLALVGERDRVAPAVAEALGHDRSPSRIAQAALVVALAGRAADARRLLEEYDRLAGLTSGRDPEFVRPAQAAVAVVERRFADVPDLLAPVAPYETGSRFECLPTFIRGHALLGLNRPADALREFQGIVASRGVAPLSFIRPLAQLGAARAHVALGQVAEGRRAYEEFFRRWSAADPDLTVVVAARAEAGRLQIR